MQVSSERESLITGAKSYSDITHDVAAPIHAKPGKFWFAGLGISAIIMIVGFAMIGYTIWFGIGTWGSDRTIGWGWDITNFVWWVGIAHAGTFISAILLLFRQKFRTSINRAAEAMTIFAVMCAGLYPLIHMGRLPLGFFIFPYPNTRELWVNFNSPLLWDVFAITAYILVSLVFWYVGLIPDFGTIRDRMITPWKKRIYEILSFGWNGSAKHWQRHESTSYILAALATPLVIAVCSIVSFDFATSVIPGWHATIFPVYFVSGALFSGFAMVMILLIITRKALNLESYITIGHIESLNKIVITTGSLVFIIYLTEIFMAWYSGNQYERFTFLNRAMGPYAWAYAMMVGFNILSSQLLWFKKLRRSLVFTLFSSLFIVIGMWFERFIIIVSSTSRDYLPSSWSYYSPTLVEVAIFAGTIGLFFTLFFLFIRVIPVIALSEVKTIARSSAEKFIPKSVKRNNDAHPKENV